MRNVIRSGGVFVLLGALLCTTAPAYSQALSEEARFEKAVKLLQRGQTRAAIPILEELSIGNPKASNLYWNLAHAQTEVGASAKALDAWKVYRRLEPSDWHGLENLIQAYYAAGYFPDGDRERDELVRLWKSGKDSELHNQKRFCRDVFTSKAGKVAVFEEFDTSSDPATYLSFAVQSGARAKTRMSLLGDLASESKLRAKGRLAKDERLFTLDLADGDIHETYRIYKHWPTYESLRKDVMDALEGKIKPISSVTIATGKS